MKIITIFLAALGLSCSSIALISCTQMPQKSLVLYYSQTGTTAKLAEELREQLGADIERFDVEQVYDGNFEQTIERVRHERESGMVPALKPLQSAVSDYDVIFLCYPIWFGTYAPPVKALLSSVDFKGKTVVPFCTFGSGGLESSAADLTQALPGTFVAKGFGIRQARMQHLGGELNRFLLENAYKHGIFEPYPDYSEQGELTPETSAIYEEATAGYPFPMGTPVSVSSREVPGGVDYSFAVEGKTPDGSVAQGTVLVSCREGRKAEFTRVIR